MNYTRAWAEVSPDERYRWVLGRQWSNDLGLPWMHFTMLNPSKANGKDDDPTVIRCVGYALRENCAGLLITNLSSYRSTDPKKFLAWVKQCERAGHLVERWGFQTDSYIRDCALQAKWNVVAWGGNAAHRTMQLRAKSVLQLLNTYGRDAAVPGSGGLFVLDRTKDGTPAHPLMLPGSLRPVPIGAAA